MNSGDGGLWCYFSQQPWQSISPEFLGDDEETEHPTSGSPLWRWWPPIAAQLHTTPPSHPFPQPTLSNLQFQTLLQNSVQDAEALLSWSRSQEGVQVIRPRQ